MTEKRAWWLLLEKSDETRVSKGIDGYQDETGHIYRYDSLVPNHKNLAAGDGILIRKEDEILGVGSIASVVKQSGAVKTHRRCPGCQSTDIRERRGKLPPWKCGKCKVEFSDPKVTSTIVTSYVATIEGFSSLDAPPRVHAVKACAISEKGTASQLSILQLSPEKLAGLFEECGDIVPGSHPAPPAGGQGFGLSPAERRAVELLAMKHARTLYENLGWHVVDTSRSNPFDLLATKGKERRYIEVKGTTGPGQTILLTRGEVDHMAKHGAEAVLIVYSGIKLAQVSGQWEAFGGALHAHLAPWNISEASLQAIKYCYTVPMDLSGPT